MLLAAIAAACTCTWTGAAGAHASTTTPPHPQDVATFTTYAKLVEEYELALIRAVPEVKAAGAAFAAALGRECGGALKGTGWGESNRNPSTSRQLGEQALASEQAEILREEATAAAEQAAFAPLHAAALALLNGLTGLHWEQQETAAELLRTAQRSTGPILRPAPAVCADVRTWVASGERRLSDGSRTFVAEQEAREEKAREEARTFSGPMGTSSLKADEDPESAALVKQAKQLSLRLPELAEAIGAATQEALVALGLESERSRASTRAGREAGSSTFGGVVRTAAGGRVPVELLRSAAHSKGCRFKVRALGRLSGQAGVCITRPVRVKPSVRCEEDSREIEVLLPGGVRAARLQLSSGRKITSPTVAIPKKSGGPAAFYVQAVPRGRGAPVSLTELGAGGRTLATIPLPAADKCVRHGLHSIAGHPVALAHVPVPGGTTDTIEANAWQYNGPIYFSLAIQSEGGGGGGEGLQSVFDKRLKRSIWSRCTPQSYELIYGVLAARGDHVVAHTAEGDTVLSEAPIPKRLHGGGVLVYGVFTAPLQSISLLDPSGKVLASESLLEESQSRREYCEGAVEPGRFPREEGVLF